MAIILASRRSCYFVRPIVTFVYAAITICLLCVLEVDGESPIKSKRGGGVDGSTGRGRQLYGSLQRQSTPQFHPVPGHQHLRQFDNDGEEKRKKRRRRVSSESTTLSSSSSASTTTTTSTNALSYTLRVGLAGGIAGAVGTAALFPFDSAKTLRQSDPARYKSVREALFELCRRPAAAIVTSTTTDGAGAVATTRTFALTRLKRLPVARAYNGLLTATLGAIPSSALYFGAYESMKKLIRSSFYRRYGDDVAMSAPSRLLIHAAAAASGNVISSMVFVPKELIKQQMQYAGTSIGRTVWNVLAEQGPRGLYRGYKATLIRNIPSAMIRFVIYEELRQALHRDSKDDCAPNSFSWKLFAAGAFAGALASGFMTPADVLKTRLSTGQCPVDVPGCLQHVIREQGWSGLYAGAGSRMAFSGAFSAIGFASFEVAKSWLGVSDRRRPQPNSIQQRTSNRATTPKRPQVLTPVQAQLEHVLEENYQRE